MTIESIIGDYQQSFQKLLDNLAHLKIDITGYQLSHIGYKTETNQEYEQVKTALLPWCNSYVENVHNGRPISKLQLKQPLSLPNGFEVSLIELMPPKPHRNYKSGIEHWGVVLGEEFASFQAEHQNKITGQQDQGSFCQPLFIRFKDDTRVKFYDSSLKDVVIKEGKQFIAV